MANDHPFRESSSQEETRAIPYQVADAIRNLEAHAQQCHLAALSHTLTDLQIVHLAWLFAQALDSYATMSYIDYEQLAGRGAGSASEAATASAVDLPSLFS